MFSKITSFFSPIFSRSIQALCPVFSCHVSLRYLSDSKRFLYRDILPELLTCTREIHDGWRASGANEPFLGSHYSLFVVFMWHHHFPKPKNINLCEVLVLPDVRPSKNLTSCNVWAWQDSSLCNRVRLNFQVCALHYIKMVDLKRSRAGKKWVIVLSFG